MNDGSTDDTNDLLEGIKLKCSNSEVLSLSSNVGKAEAVRLGTKMIIQSINAEYIGYMDADLATPLSFISKMEEQLKNNIHIDLIFGSRLLADRNSIERKMFRHYSGRFVSRMINRAIGEKFGDTQCGAKLMRSSLAALVFIDPFKSTWLFDVEMIKRTLLAGKEVKEIPVTQWRDVGNSKVSKWYFFKMFGELRRIRKLK